MASALFVVFDVNRFSDQQKFLILLQVFLVTVLIPLVFFAMLRVLGRADSWMLPQVSQRQLPLAFQTVLFAVLITASFTYDKVPMLFGFFISAGVSSLVALGLSFARIKASLHMMGMAGLLAFAFCVCLKNGENHFLFLSGLTFCTGLVASSRIGMNAHDVKELVIGFGIGVVPQWVVFYLMYVCGSAI